MTPSVSVVSPGGDRTSYRLRYRDPITGRQHWRTARTADRREADRAAVRWEEELSSGQHATTARMTWEAFRKRYETEYMPSMAKKTQANYKTTMNLFEELVGAKRLAAFSPALLSDFAAKLRKTRAEDSVKTYLNHLSAILGWAKRMKLIGFVPEKPRINRTRASGSHMKGRPITDTEFATMLAAVPGIVGQRAAASWSKWLNGLWLSGMRLEESLYLSWDLTGKMIVDLTGKFPMFRIRRHWEKGHKDRLLAIAPEFAAFLLAIPEYERTGLVFRLEAVDPEKPKGGGRVRNMPGEIAADWAGTICRRIGKASGVVVDTSETGRIKHVSAHDLRRSFGSRWASRVMPIILKELMRHEDIKTTMKYYIGSDAERTAEAAYAAIRLPGGEVSNGSVSGSVKSKSTARKGRKKVANTDTVKS